MEAASGQIRPRGSLVLVRGRTDEERETTGGLVIPGAIANAGFIYGIILRLGPGRRLESATRDTLDDLKVGDTVLMKSQRGLPLTVEDKHTFLINETDILAVVEDK